MVRQDYIQAVELAKGWMFIPEKQFVKIPGFTEPFDVMSMNTATKNALAMQLIEQVDQAPKCEIVLEEDGRTIVFSVEDEQRTGVLGCGAGESRAINTIGAILLSKVLK